MPKHSSLLEQLAQINAIGAVDAQQGASRDQQANFSNILALLGLQNQQSDKANTLAQTQQHLDLVTQQAVTDRETRAQEHDVDTRLKMLNYYAQAGMALPQLVEAARGLPMGDEIANKTHEVTVAGAVPRVTNELQAMFDKNERDPAKFKSAYGLWAGQPTNSNPAAQEAVGRVPFGSWNWQQPQSSPTAAPFSNLTLADVPSADQPAFLNKVEQNALDVIFNKQEATREAKLADDARKQQQIDAFLGKSKPDYRGVGRTGF